MRRLESAGLIEDQRTVFCGMDALQCCGQYFFLPRQIIFLDLTSKELAIYAYLMYLEDRFTNQCWPSYKTIGKNVGVRSANTIRKFVRMLEWKNLIFTEQTFLFRPDGTVRNANLRYTIRPIIDALDFRHQRQVHQLEESAEAQNAQRRVQAYLAQNPETGLVTSFAEGEGCDRPPAENETQALVRPNPAASEGLPRRAFKGQPRDAYCRFRKTKEKAGESSGVAECPAAPTSARSAGSFGFSERGS